MDFSKIKSFTIPEGNAKSLHINGVLFWSVESEPETLSPGLYDANDNLLASWDALVNTYGLDCSKDYTAFDFPVPTTTLRSIVNKNTELSNAVKLVIGDNISRIGNYAFNYCSFLTSIAFSNSVTSIGSSVFGNCSNLKRLDFSAHTSIPTLEGSILGPAGVLQIKVPASLIDDWKSATNWSEKADKIVTEFTNEV